MLIEGLLYRTILELAFCGGKNYISVTGKILNFKICTLEIITQETDLHPVQIPKTFTQFLGSLLNYGFLQKSQLLPNHYKHSQMKHKYLITSCNTAVRSSEEISCSTDSIELD